MARKALGLAGLAGAALAAAAYVRRGAARRRERVDLYYDDGSLVTLGESDGARLLEIARGALRG
jgi:hypothetical protein